MLDPDIAAKLAADKGISGSLPELAENPTMRDDVQTGIDAANKKLSRVEQIKKFTIVPDTWQPSGNYLTPKGSLKRKAIDAGYADMIDAIYERVGKPERAFDSSGSLYR